MENKRQFDNQVTVVYTVLAIGVILLCIVGGFLIYTAKHL